MKKLGMNSNMLDTTYKRKTYITTNGRNKYYTENYLTISQEIIDFMLLQEKSLCQPYEDRVKEEGGIWKTNVHKACA